MNIFVQWKLWPRRCSSPLKCSKISPKNDGINFFLLFYLSIELVPAVLHLPFPSFYAGQPKRHLLTTGWSLFVGSKRLRAGDSVLFIR